MTYIPNGRIKEKTPVAHAEIADAMARVEAAVGEHFPEVLNPLKAALAVATVGGLKDNSQPTALHLLGPPGVGKTLPLSFTSPADEQDVLNRYFYRSDKFTTASFVSHRADLSREKLAEEVDLLPRIKGKTLVTKELAPLFHGKREELTERFSVLASVLDGRGFTSDSGAQGQRGYVGAYNFQWLGATTPLSSEALEAMGQVGPRIVFYTVDRPPKTTDELANLLTTSAPRAEQECGRAVRTYLRTLYATLPPKSVSGRDIIIDQQARRFLALWAQVLVALRATGSDAAEHPERVLLILKNIAIGSALSHGRSAVNDYDLAQIRHIALSSGALGRGKVLGALLDCGGRATTPEIREHVRLSTPTVLEHMKKLQRLRLAFFEDGKPATVKVRRLFHELCDAPRLEQFD